MSVGQVAETIATFIPGVGQIIDEINSENTTAEIQASIANLATFTQEVTSDAFIAIDLVLHAMNLEVNAWKVTDGKVSDAAHYWLADAKGESLMWTRLLNTILPNSLHYVDNKVRNWVNSTIVPPLNKVIAEAATLEADVTSLYNWRSSYADKWLARYAHFYNTDQTDVLTVTDKWIAWLKTPADFGSWAAQYIASPLVTFLGNGSHYNLERDLIDNLITALTRQPGTLETQIVNILETVVS